MDWKRIKAEYIAGGTSYRKLVEKYGVKLSALRSVAEREKWVELKAQAQHKTNIKIVDTVSDKGADEAAKIIEVADKLLIKISEVIDKVHDTKGIKNISSALKDIKEIKGVKSDADMREQEARIEKLRKEADREDDTTNEVEVIFNAGPGEWNE